MKMFKNSGTLFSDLSHVAVENWMNSFDTVLCDCDGVLWCDNDPIKGSNEVVNKFKAMGKQVFFVTNNSTKTRVKFLEKARKFNFDMTDYRDIISSAFLAAQYLKRLNFTKKVYVIGCEGMTGELDLAGIKHCTVGPDVLTTSLSQFVNEDFEKDPEIGAVVVGFDEHFSFPKMLRAASYLSDPDVIFIGTNTDERLPMAKIVIPETGSIVRAVETCAERDAIIVGKPESFVCDYLIDDYNIDPKTTLMIGDRCNTDMLMGKNCGFQTLLVETGIHNRDDVQVWKDNDSDDDKYLVPDIIATRLSELLPYLD